MSEEEHDKEERLRTIESDLEFEKENDLSLSPVVTYKLKVLHSQALDTQFASKKDKQRADILEIFKQVKVNLPFLEAIREIPTYAVLLKDMCTFKRKSKDDKS